MNIVEIYCDDGISGTTFDRADFKRMMKDVENKKINMIITKDLSRFGRDYSEMGTYIDKLLPTNKVRFVAVNDDYDSSVESSANDFVPFKNVFNDMYAKDISRKVRTALKTKQLKGQYIGTTAPFGYLKDENIKGKLIPDPISSECVKKIFGLFLAGTPLLAITNILTEQKIPTPSQHRNLKSTQKYLKGAWNDKAVRFILKNEVYIGNTVQNKKKKINYKLKNQINIPEKQWIKVENTHEPIISKEDFYNVKAILSKRSYQPRKGHIHLLTGFMFCGNCGAPITFMPQHKKDKFYTCCSTAKRYKKELGLCKMQLIPEEIIEDYILHNLRKIANEYVNKEKVAKNTNKIGISTVLDSKKKMQRSIVEKIENIKQTMVTLYKDKVRGIVDENQFITISNNLNGEKEQYVLELERIDAEIISLQSKKEDSNELMKIIDNFLKFEQIDRNTLALLVGKVIINLDKSIEIHFTFKEI